jgi:hypothetical protein
MAQRENLQICFRSVIATNAPGDTRGIYYIGGIQGPVAAAFFTAALALCGCGGLLAQSPGDYFDQQLAKIDFECKKRGSGSYGDSPVRSSGTSCDFLLLKPWQPRDTPESTFAHSIRLPPTLEKPAHVYQTGMTPKQYFDALCNARAGEYIARTVTDVPGIVQLRARAQESSTLNRHLTAFEDPATYEGWQARPANFFVGPKKYQFFEYQRMAEGGLPIVRYAGYDGENASSMETEKDSKRLARYGFTWRGIPDEHALNFGIAGGEVIVLDVQTEEVLAVKRKFSLRYLGRYGEEQMISFTGIEQGIKCDGRSEPGKAITGWELRDFIIQVLKPAKG